MSLPEHIFREYDIRGIADEDLTSDVCESIGRAFGTALKREGKTKVTIGYDMRPSSERIRTALSRGLQSTGAQVLDLGLTPTPLLYFSVDHFGYDAGISVTGSHNPPEYNGFKLHLAERPFFGEEIQGLKKLIQENDFDSGEGSEEKAEVIPAYIDHVKKLFNFSKKLKVVVDSGHGMGGIVAPQLLKELGCDVVELYSNLDSNFPDHHPDPSLPENLEDVKAKVLETGADIGIAFDGDADRVGVIDEKGEDIPGDKTLLLYAWEILQRKPGATVIGDVKCSKVIYDSIAEKGGKPVMWKTGHSLIKAKLKETGAELAGEMSGHMFFVDRWFGFDDAIYAACRMLEILDQAEAPLSQHLDGLPELVSTPEIRVDCPDDVKFQIVEKAVEAFKAEYKVVDIDGARVEFEDGWGLVRASNTQPVLVMRFEAQSQARLEEIQSLVESKIEEVKAAL